MCRVLVVDDSSVSLKLALFVLKSIGCQVTGVSSASSAFDELQCNQYDAVLMDIYMPEMNGYEATAFIKEGGAGESNSKIPIIAMSSADQPEEHSKSRLAGMVDFIPKPFTGDTVKTTLLKFCPVFLDRNSKYDEIAQGRRDYACQE
ncbi:MAG: response regulator [Synergistaceae bacterium]|nr:response regulator [Synergistaceae bacterium]